MVSIPQPHIIRSHRSSITIEISKEGEVIVKAPKLAPMFLINQFIQAKMSWIERSLQKVQERQPVKKSFAAGETFLVLGKEYTLKFHTGTKIGLKENYLYVPLGLKFRIKRELEQWYKDQAKTIIIKRVEYHSQKMKTSYKDIFFSDTSSKWGTCFADNRLQFNWRLVMTPLMVLDYVVIHELVHTTEKHHQTAFWRKVRQYTPAYRQHRKWLEQNAHLLQF